MSGVPPPVVIDSPLGPPLRYGVVALLVVGGVLFYFQTADPMMLVFTLIVAAVAWAVIGIPFARGAGRAEIRVRCRSCSGLNPEDARYCNACGKTL